MTDLELIHALTDLQVVALTLFGEARGSREGIEGRIAVANVIRNRVKAQRKGFGLTARDVCLKPWQFSCWTRAGGDENYSVLLDAARFLVRGEKPGPMLTECLWIADGLLRDQFSDTVRNATHYLTADLLATKAPTWTVGLLPVCSVHSHVFFAGVA